MTEAVIIVCRNSTEGEPLLTSLKLFVSSVLVDEAGHAFEPETLIPLISNTRMAQNGRVHAVLIGDYSQISPLFVCNDHAVMFVSRNRKIHFPLSMRRQFESILERLFRTERCIVSCLTHHYRSHPRLGNVVHRNVYSDLLQHPVPAENFDASFNNFHDGNRGLQFVTIIYTRAAMRRYESRIEVNFEDGNLINTFEAKIVNDVCFLISNNSDGFDLTNKMFYISFLQPNGLLSSAPRAITAVFFEA